MEHCTDWQPYFAWKPVYVDAYDASEFKNGKTRYLKWGWVERKFCVLIDVDDEDQVERRVWRFRILKPERE